MNEVQKQRDNALMSAAAYTDFFDKNGSRIGKDTIQRALINDSSFTQQDVDYFNANFEVIHQQLETTSGFSAAVIKDKRTGQMNLAVRGTSDIDDLAQDIDLVVQGLP
ncbi:hypothetical protein INT80_00620 [Gallibacterium anatis]|nr:hypothetical protein [Gallibacterium anatis]